MLLTLLDNLGFTDNYMECMVPTVGVYPIATANDKAQISAPLMSRFAVIDIPDYTSEEKKIIFSKFALPKVLKRMSLKQEECIVTDEALDAVIKKIEDTTESVIWSRQRSILRPMPCIRLRWIILTGVVFDGELWEVLS